MVDNSTAKVVNTTVESQPSSIPRKFGASFFAALAAFLLAVLLTTNLWLMSAQLRTITDNSREHAFWAVCHSGTTAEMRSTYLLNLVAAGNTEWRSAYLSKLSMDGVNLSSASLFQIGLSSGSFVDADFSKADLSGAALDLSDFSEADFSESNLRNATFFKSRLVDADFRNADMLSISL